MDDHLVIGGQLGNYLIDSVIGRGGMSVVYRARHSRLGNSVALKVLAPELSVDDTFRERFLREAQMAAAVDHPNVIPIHDMGVHGESLYIVMRYVSGGDLKDLLRTSSPLEPLRALTLMMPIALALDAAHDHELVHRDVKPANILTQRSKAGDIEHVYLTDFGIAKSAASMTGLTRAGAFIGTVEYMAPEQLEGGEVTAQTDVYAFAATFYECVTGRIPFQRELAEGVRPPRGPLDPVSSVQPGVPAALDAVIEQGLARNSADRYATCDQFLEACSDALDGRSEDVPAAAAPANVAATELSARDATGAPAAGAAAAASEWSRTGADETVEPVGTGASDPPPPPAFEPPAQPAPVFEPPAASPPAFQPPAQPPAFEPAAQASPAFEPAAPPPERKPPGDRPSRGFRPWYAVVLVLLLAAVAGAVVALSGKSSTPQGKLSSTALAQVPTNHVTGSGDATIRLNGDQAAVTVTTTGLDNGAALVHAMHIHAGGKGECPPASAARPHNGHLTISTTDGINYYGPPVTALTTSGDTSPASILAFPRFLTGGTLRYTRTITLPEKVAADIRANNAVIVVHGIDYDGSGIYSGVLDRSELNTSLPGTATAPALCGPLVAAQTAALNRRSGGHGGIYTASLALSAAPAVPLQGVFFCHVPEGIASAADARRQTSASAAAPSRA